MASAATVPGGAREGVSPQRARGLSGLLATPVGAWHVSPVVDLIGYSFAWVLIVPAMYWLVGSDPVTGFSIFIVTTLVTDLHRHYTLPYVYLDRGVRARFPMRFWLLPAVFAACLTQSPALARSASPLASTEWAAIAAWIVWLVQIVRQDRGGWFQLNRALPAFLVTVLGGALWSGMTAPGTEQGSAWLLCALAGSIWLHVAVLRDGEPDRLAGRRAHVGFPLTIGALAAAAFAGALDATSISLRTVANVVLMSFLLWHVYHVLMQKYGILRIYSAKSGRPEKVPAWVDRLLVWCIVPALFVWVGANQLPALTERLSIESPGLDRTLVPFLALLGESYAVLISLSFALIAGAALAFLYYEWRVHALRCWPRLAYAAGSLLFYSTFFTLGLFGFYSSFAFAHGIEYMVFIWAFQKRRYAAEPAQTQAPGLARLLRHPMAFYLGSTAVLAAALFYVRYQPRFSEALPRLADLGGESPMEWVRWYTIYQGILHFYYDGFLWKMRRPEVRAQM